MKTVTLPNTTLSVSQLCLGSTDIGSTIPRAESFELLDAFCDGGGNFIDTAAVYANWLPGERSVSEKTIGAWMQARGNRERLVIATKGAHYDLATPHILRCTPREIVADLNASLRNLQVETIDLYYLHRDDPTRPVAEIIDVLNEQVHLGKIRFFGCSNWRTERIVAAQEYARAQGISGFIANQMLWSLAQVDVASFSDPTMCAMDDKMWRYHKQTGMAAVAYSSQANGLFHKLASDGYGQLGALRQRIYAGAENLTRGQRVQQLTLETGLTVTQVVLGYLLSQPFVTVPIVGCKTLLHLRDSLTAAETQLSANQVQWLLGNSSRSEPITASG